MRELVLLAAGGVGEEADVVAVEHDEAVVLLRAMRQTMGEDGLALIGVDLHKDTATLEAAYNDAAGVTAAFTLNLLQRLNREIGIGYEDDIDLAEKIMRDHAEADSRVLKDPAISTHVDQLGDSAVVITLWYWTAASNFWPTSREMIKKVKKSFDENGISIPFPQVTYHGTPQMVALPERFVDARSKEV